MESQLGKSKCLNFSSIWTYSTWTDLLLFNKEKERFWPGHDELLRLSSIWTYLTWTYQAWTVCVPCLYMLCFLFWSTWITVKQRSHSLGQLHWDKEHVIFVIFTHQHQQHKNIRWTHCTSQIFCSYVANP